MFEGRNTSHPPNLRTHENRQNNIQQGRHLALRGEVARREISPPKFQEFFHRLYLQAEGIQVPT
jgi:hypothetical protein